MKEIGGTFLGTGYYENKVKDYIEIEPDCPKCGSNDTHGINDNVFRCKKCFVAFKVVEFNVISKVIN